MPWILGDTTQPFITFRISCRKWQTKIQTLSVELYSLKPLFRSNTSLTLWPRHLPGNDRDWGMQRKLTLLNCQKCDSHVFATAGSVMTVSLSIIGCSHSKKTEVRDAGDLIQATEGMLAEWIVGLIFSTLLPAQIAKCQLFRRFVAVWAHFKSFVIRWE